MSLLAGFSLGCISLCFVIVARDFRHLAVARVFMALLIAASAFFIRNDINPAYRWLAGDIMTMLPALFWLLCQLAFARRPQVISIWGALALYSFVTPAITRYFGVNHAADGEVYLVGWYIPRYAEYAVILNGFWVIIANWKDDLIHSRRQLRAAFLITVGLTGMWVTISLNTGHGSSISIPIITSLCALITSALILKGREGVLLGPKGNAAPIIHVVDKNTTLDVAKSDVTLDASFVNSEEDKSALKLHLLMEQGFYRTAKLTLKRLSKEMDIPEYKVRALINTTFNYRNFNDYINQLRIEEAIERLVKEPDTPIQNIALDIGYRTLSSFNRAFKEIQNQTPTDYRQTHNKI